MRRWAAHARFVTSVCTGALLLGAAGLLRGKRATTHWSAFDLLAEYGATPTRGRVVKDGSLITGGGVTAGIDFGLEIAALLAGDDAAQAIQLAIEYDPAPPFHAGHPDRAPQAVVRMARERLAQRQAGLRDAIAASRTARA
jgi:cyclohexyl-isocyanide hydratase